MSSIILVVEKQAMFSMILSSLSFAACLASVLIPNMAIFTI